MKTWLIIMIVLFGGVSALYRRLKKAFPEGGNPQDSVEPQSFVGGEAEDSDDFFDFADGEAEETVAPQPAYFTYESPEAEIHTEVRPAPVVEVAEEMPRPQFDLRQAVIYQTLLNNRYINLQN